ncbi:MAG: hypothetical protein ACREJ3_15760, partial [Polyangiaceae bacterium]
AQGLDAAARDALVSRAGWIEDEARAATDSAARARGLLAASELHASLGDHDVAYTLAVEARDLAPSLLLAHRQALALMPRSADREARLAALDAEFKATSAAAARLHVTLLAIELLRADGDDDAAQRRLDHAARLAPEDARVAVARAARALARGDIESSALHSQIQGPIGDAIGVCLRLRGAAGGESADSAETSASEIIAKAGAALAGGDLGAEARLAARLAQVPGLEGGSRWLAASLGACAGQELRDLSTTWLLDLAQGGDAGARRALATRALERGDADLIARALADPEALAAPERVTLATLAGFDLSPADPQIAETAETEGMWELACAVTALSTPVQGGEETAQVRARAERTAGSPDARAQTRLGRALATSSAPEIEAALVAPGGADLGDPARAIGLEMAARAGRVVEVSERL